MTTSRDALARNLKLRVLLDCDGVLSDFVGAYLAVLEETLGIKATREQIDDYSIERALRLTKEQSVAVSRTISETTGIARDLAVCPGAIDGVLALQEIAEVYIVTSPWNANRSWTHDREWWLREHFGIHHSRVLHGSAKHLVSGDVFVDDKPDAVREWAGENPMGVAILWSTPHNRKADYSGIRTNEWSELLKIVSVLAGNGAL